MPMTPGEITAYQRWQREWASTDIGKAFLRFESAHAHYWLMDGQDHVSDHRLKEAHRKCEEARETLLKLLRPLAGLRADP